jgi:hypothetical protein
VPKKPNAESIAIRYRTRDAAHADSTAGAGYVFNNDGIVSVGPPAENGTIIVIGRDG